VRRRLVGVNGMGSSGVKGWYCEGLRVLGGLDSWVEVLRPAFRCE